MDFGAMTRPIGFGKKPQESPDGVPAPVLLKEVNRRLAALREAGEVLEVLPGPGESLHALMTGRYDLTDLLEVILRRKGAVKHLRVATLSFNRHNSKLLEAWTRAGQVGRLTLLCSLFFRDHNPETFQGLRETLGPPHRIAASRNHCKVCCLEFEAGEKWALEGSANLRTNSNREQFALVASPVLHDWHALWIDEQVMKHEGDKSPSPAKG